MKKKRGEFRFRLPFAFSDLFSGFLSRSLSISMCRLSPPRGAAGEREERSRGRERRGRGREAGGLEVERVFLFLSPAAGLRKKG